MYPKTIMIDIDGTIFKHHGAGIIGQVANIPVLLDGVLDKFNEWAANNYTVVLITGRPEAYRELTVKQLQRYHIPYTTLIMGLPRGDRVVVNDSKTGDDTTAHGITVKRNKGIRDIEA